jgi:hypothetical protein
MKLLGDDCWWAPRWMKRLQNKIGLGEIYLPDERKRLVVREPSEALVGAGAPAPTDDRRPVHDPTHPGGEARPRPRVVGRAEYQAPPARPEPPSAAGTARMPDPQAVPPNEAPTTRFAVAKNVVKHAVSNATAAARSNRTVPPPAPDREIESWLGELRGKPSATPPQPQPSAEPTNVIPAPDDATRAIPTQRDQNGTDDVSPTISAEETRAIPVSKPEPSESDVATEKLNARGKKEGEDRPRRGGGVSAQDLLRREGRL